MKDITLTEFWRNKDHLAIHCGTRTKATTLLNAFDKLGKRWDSDYSYLDRDYYSIYHQDTCYLNNHTFAPYDWCEKMGYIIFEFDTVDLEN